MQSCCFRTYWCQPKDADNRVSRNKQCVRHDCHNWIPGNDTAIRRMPERCNKRAIRFRGKMRWNRNRSQNQTKEFTPCSFTLSRRAGRCWCCCCFPRLEWLKARRPVKVHGEPSTSRKFPMFRRGHRCEWLRMLHRTASRRRQRHPKANPAD